MGGVAVFQRWGPCPSLVWGCKRSLSSRGHAMHVNLLVSKIMYIVFFFLYVCCLIKITILKVAAYVGVCFSYTPGVPLQKFSWLCIHTCANRKVSCVYHPLKHKTLTNVWLKTKYISNPTGKTQLTWRSLFTWDTSGERQEGQASP